MTSRKLLKIYVGLLLFFVVAVGLTSIYHPIILKWLSGTARHIGKPVIATVYTNGQINPDIKVFHVDKYWNGEEADYYLVYSPYADKSKVKFFSLNRKDNYAGIPTSTNIKDYDLIAGHLFQSEIGATFSPFTSDMKGFDSDPLITFKDKQIILNIPPAATALKCDSMRIEL